MKTDLEYILSTLKEIVEVDSPSGFCKAATDKVASIIDGMGYKAVISNKGCIEVDIKGRSDAKKIGVAAHLDTLGALVRSISGDGMIRFSTVGGLLLPTVDGEYCRIYTREGKVYTGTFLSLSPSVHVYDDARTAPRDTKHMYIRLDEKVKTEADVRALGIQTGDYIALEPKFTVTDSGFVKSRFLDDKASVAVILAALRALKESGKQPAYDTRIILTVYEEVGHGASPHGQGLSEVLAVDMGCIGLDLKCTEYDVSICAEDSTGPYDYDLVTRLINLAKKENLNYAIDLYPHYGSDVSAMLRAGRDIRGGLIGAGIHASHGMERTHTDGLMNTFKLLMAYLTE